MTEPNAVFVEISPVQEVLPDEKIPEVASGEPVILNSEPDRPFRMICTSEDWAVMMETMQRLQERQD
jgi:hypothetical protein